MKDRVAYNIILHLPMLSIHVWFVITEIISWYSRSKVIRLSLHFTVIYVLQIFWAWSTSDAADFISAYKYLRFQSTINLFSTFLTDYHDNWRL